MTGTPRIRAKSRPWQQGGEEPVSFGTWLRRQREVREISLREIADASRISLRYLEAFEQDRFDILPAPVFARGFLREYAKYVGLDPDEVVNYFLSAQQALQPEEEEGEREPPRQRSGGWWKQLLLVAGVGAAIVLVAVIAFQAERGRSRRALQAAGAAPPAPPLAPEPGVASAVGLAAGASVAPAAASPPSPPVALAPSTGLSVSLHFKAACWVEAVVDGRSRHHQEHRPGESLQLDAREYVLLTLGNAGGVEVRVNGRPFELGRGSGQVARGVRIDLSTARALAEGP
jgi:cytoskeletal protein RodZ